MYLYGFERICQDISGDPTFRVPFWDWSNNPFVPAPFWTPGGPLSCPRAIQSNQQLPAPATWPQNMAQLLRIRTFDTFASPFASKLRPDTRIFGALERPHNDVHNSVGGVMSSMMSPLDPVFWVHHANIDRLWWEWNRRGNQNTTNSYWLNFATGSAIMPDQGGTLFPFRVRDALTTDALGYTYDSNWTTSLGFDNGRSGTAAEQELLPEQVPAGSITRTGSIGVSSASTFSPDDLPPSDRTGTEAAPPPPPSIRAQNEAINRILGVKSDKAASDSSLQAALQLILQGIPVPKNTASQLRVFLNLPRADARTPTEGANFAGALSFFGSSMDHKDHALDHDAQTPETVSALFDITEQITQLGIESLDDLTISLVAVAPAGAAAEDAQTSASGVRFVVYRNK
jgi:tyrosinase